MRRTWLSPNESSNSGKLGSRVLSLSSSLSLSTIFRSRASLRRESIALFLATLINQACGFPGIPLRGQILSACSKVSCTMSSVICRFSGPKMPVRIATISP